MNDPMLNFVKDKLEENEGISSEALAHLIAASKSTPKHAAHSWWFGPYALLAASLAIVACGPFLLSESADECRKNNLTNVITLLRVADECEEGAESSSLVDTLQAWQDAPCLVSSDD